MRVFEVVEAATSEAPPLRHSVEDIVTAGQRYQRRRQRRWAAGGAAALSLLMIVGVVGIIRVTNWRGERTAGPGVSASPSGSTRTDPSAGASPATSPGPSGPESAAAPPVLTPGGQPFTFTFQGYVAGRITVRDPTIVSTAYQLAPIVGPGYRPNTGVYGYLAVYRPGAYDIDAFGGAAGTVGGHRAREKTGEEYGATRRQLAWEYATDAWAVVVAAQDATAADLQAVATGFKAGTSTPARVPFTMSYVPTGYVALSVGMHALAGMAGIALFEEGDYGGALFVRSAPGLPLARPWSGTPQSGLDRAFELSVIPADASNQLLAPGEKVPADPKCNGNFVCNRWTADGRTQFQATSDGTVPESELAKILRGLKFAAVGDERTWANANTELPGIRK